VLAVVAVLALAAPPGCAPPHPPVPRPAAGVISDPAAKGVFEGAIAAVEASPREAITWMNLGMLYEAQGLLELALPCYEEATRLQPSNPHAWYRVALAREQLGDIPSAVAAVTHAAQLAPDQAHLAWRRGLWLLALGDSDGAEQAFKSAARINPSDPRGIYGLARVDLDRGKPEAALAALDSLQQSPSADPLIHHLRAAALRGLGRGEEAEHEAARAGGSRPDWDDPWQQEVRAFEFGFWAEFRKAKALAEAGRNEEAAEILERLRADHPNRRSPREILAAVRWNSGQKDAAIDEWTKLSDEGSIVADVNLSGALESLGRHDEALKRADAAIELNPTLARAHVARAHACQALGRTQDAVASLREAVRLSPGDEDLLLELAEAESDAGEPPAVMLATYQRVIALDGAAVVKARFGAALTLLSLGRIDEAEKLVDTLATSEGPKDPTVVSLRGEIARLRSAKP
jgi:tetratricopeptide (TPR) repeat protein